MPRNTTNERQPLLGNPDSPSRRRPSTGAGPGEGEGEETQAITPLPKLQLALLFFMRATDPICFNVIFPFINQMLLDIGAVKDPREVGYYAGLVESLFSLTQLFTIFHWGALSDRIGRKPVLLLGCLGSSISALMFGFSKTFTWVVIARCLNGMMNGNLAVLKCALAEMTDKTNQARAVSLFPICLNGGIIVASFLGGQLSNTKGWDLARRFPIFEEYPYLLCMGLSALFPLVSATCAFFFMKETLPSKPRKGDEEEVMEDEGVVLRVPDGPPKPAKASTRELMTKHIGLLIFTFGIQSVIGVSLGSLLPLFCFTPIQDGGLGMGADTIGFVISMRSIVVLVLQVFGFPFLAKRIGLNRLHRWAMVLWVSLFAILPATNFAARAGQEWLVWTELYVFMVVGALAMTCSVCNLLMTNNAAPRPELLGTLNGLSQMTGSMVGVFGPGSAGALFAVSIERHLLGGQLVWLVMGAVAASGAVAGFFIRDEDA